ncbi:hypothetical protein CP985_14055 [Malaciobacter mytili LMG 24559]|uniref:Cobalt/nickel ECF transporter CbiMNQO, S component CbiN n=1 Tax=Malaciobacter mytili LMG 24559 TaxID=1032238 RepID=A0AAX2AEC2_9BACT|nr:hypothetical protein [Malaciobacter mytili]AXH15805.1 cobalt/nickel ECF transporter CbiMNQO, S component CbiN [Malaciobacter mytili LMG 24559]RXK12902.1 hypothetical protein CP985_14055 [Malaciobacter mytili LMG 24559]
MKIFLILTIFVLQLFAHKLNLFTTYEKDTLFISAYFASGNGCQNCKIKIEDETGQLIQKAFTNTQGEASFNINKNSFYILVDAGGGHIVKEKITKEISDKIVKEEKKPLNSLEEENFKLKAKVKALEEKLEKLEFLKTIFALFIIFGIFYILKRVKK